MSNPSTALLAWANRHKRSLQAFIFGLMIASAVLLHLVAGGQNQLWVEAGLGLFAGANLLALLIR